MREMVALSRYEGIWGSCGQILYWTIWISWWVKLTYKFSSYDVPVLGIGLKVSIAHQLIVLEDGNPATLWFAGFSIWRCFGLFNSHRVCIKVLKNDVVKESYFLIFIKLKFNVCLARFLLHSHSFVRYQAIYGYNVELLFIHMISTCGWRWQIARWFVKHVRIIVLLLAHLYQVIEQRWTVNHYYCLLFEFFHNLS